MARVPLSGAVEGPADEAVLRAIVNARGGSVHRVHVQGGKPNLRRALPGYNAAARRAPWLVLVDLDHDEPCAPAFVEDWLPNRHPLMAFRVAVRQIEAWVLADCERFASFFGVRRGHVPTRPDELPDPKATVLSLVGKSTKRAIREDMVPRARSGRRVGPAYAARLVEFVSQPYCGWRPDVAASGSPSLRRCLRSLDGLLK